MSERPLVSICLPTYNGSRFVGKTLESVLSQDYSNIEIHISDHCSSDNTRTIIQSFEDSRISISIQQPGGGAENNWNASISQASGKYVKLLCQDDVLKKSCISEQVDLMEQHPEATFCFSPRDVISPGGRKLISARGFKPKTEVVELSDYLKVLVGAGTNIFGEPCSVLMRGETLRKTKRFTGSYLIDLNMWIDLWKMGPSVFCSHSLSQFRISSDSWTSELDGQHFLQIKEKFADLLCEYPLLISENDIEIGLAKAKKLERNRRRLTRLVELLHI